MKQPVCLSKNMSAHHRLTIPTILLVVLLGTRFGGFFSLPPSNISAFWPANALLFSAVFLLQKRQKVMTLLLALPTYAAAELWIGYPLGNAILYGFANVAEVAVLLWLLRWTATSALAFDCLKDLFLLLSLALLASAAGGAIGTLVATQTGGAFAAVFLRWSLADFFGYCLFVPLVLTWRQWQLFFSLEAPARVMEFAAMVMVLLLVSVPSSGVHFLGVSAPFGAQFLPLPILLWAALRFGPPGGAIATVIVACVAFFSATRGVGLFAAGAPEDNVASLQLFFAALVVSVMTIASLNVERKQAEAALRNSEEKYRTLIQKLQTAVVVHAADTRIVTCNVAAQTLLGLTEDQLLGKTSIDPEWHFFREDRSAMPPEEYPVNQVMSTCKPLRNLIVGVHRSANTQDVWVMVNANPVFSPNNEVSEIIVTFIDVTDRRLDQEKLAHLASIVESSDDAIIGKTLDETIVSWNRGAERIYGYSAVEIIGRSISMIVPPGLRDELVAIMDGLKRGERVEHLETTRLRKDGQLIHVALTISPIRDTSGRIIGASTIARDITERKQAEKDIHQLNLALEQRVAERTVELLAANKELEAFAYSVSHDLRAPLRHIDGFLDLLKARIAATLDDKSQHYMDTISYAAKRMGVLIDDLLAFSRMGRTAMATENVDLGVLLKEVILEFEPETKERDIHWHIDALPVVTGDRAMLRLVLVNLISNALKFTQTRAQTEIAIGSQPDAAANTVIYIRDNGVGFDMKYADKLFNVFQRLHGNDEFEGIGIGLANVRRVINRHGGRTWAQSQVDGGATFYFSLPHVAAKEAMHDKLDHF